MEVRYSSDFDSDLFLVVSGLSTTAKPAPAALEAESSLSYKSSPWPNLEGLGSSTSSCLFY